MVALPGCEWWWVRHEIYVKGGMGGLRLRSRDRAELMQPGDNRLLVIAVSCLIAGYLLSGWSNLTPWFAADAVAA